MTGRVCAWYAANRSFTISGWSSERCTSFPPSLSQMRSEERRVGKECRSLCDWSSDVCSSDLDDRQGLRLVRREPLFHDLRLVIRTLYQLPAIVIANEIGRASCRERV